MGCCAPVWLLVFLLVAISCARSDGQLSPGGANVCKRSVSFAERYQQSYSVSWKKRTTAKCGLWGWGRCTAYRTVYGKTHREAYRQSYRDQYYCCAGWQQLGNSCPVAICKDACMNGTCTRPDFCSCNAGYHGKLCDKVCPPHKWGLHCSHDCTCQNGAKCDARTGACTCAPGWQGNKCEKPCDQGYYGNKCQQTCQCFNGATCEPIDGNCTCAAGYKGVSCNLPCDRDWFGKECKNSCACLNGAVCDHVTGSCNCTAGWTGPLCASRCPVGTYGYRCSKNCTNCHNGASCDPVNGTCACAPGYRGPTFTERYQQSYSFSWKKRTTTKCGLWRWSRCTAYRTVYGTSHRVAYRQSYRDQYYCCAGWQQQGNSCPVAICKDACMNGTCTRPDFCSCNAGYHGKLCDIECPAGTFGQGCKPCGCQNGASCDHVNGTCNCTAGWQGALCDQGRGYKKVGCYLDKGGKNRPLPKLLKDFRPVIDWNDLPAVVDKCATEAKKWKYSFFAIQFYGECWSGPNAGKTYDKDGPSNLGCYNGVGGPKKNFVYRFT